MVVSVEPGCPVAVKLNDPEDLQNLHVEVAADVTDSYQALRANDLIDSTLEPEWKALPAQTWLKADTLSAMAEGRVPPGWSRQFDAMLEYAASKGWYESTGKRVAAHVVVR